VVGIIYKLQKTDSKEIQGMNKIKVKYLQPIESVYVKLQDGTDFHWFNTKLIPANQQQTDLDIEWINGRPCRVSYLQGGESKEV